MPLDLADLARKRKSVAVSYGGDSFTVEYCPQRVNPAYQTVVKRMKGAADDADDAEMWEKILSVLTGWDLLDGGKPLPLNKDSLARLPSDLLIAITQAVTADVSPNQESGGSSAAG